MQFNFPQCIRQVNIFICVQTSRTCKSFCLVMSPKLFTCFGQNLIDKLKEPIIWKALEAHFLNYPLRDELHIKI